jgi:UDP-N-acetylmuramoylalanine--D-glutamate ligase
MAIAHIIGLGKSGLAAANLLKFQDWQVIIHDRGDTEALQRQQQDLGSQNIEVRLGQLYNPEAPDFQAPDVIVVSPGVPWDLPHLVQARAMGLDMVGEMGLAWRHLNRIPWVGITGTNGKTTTTALVEAIFTTAGLTAPACGNIGYATCDLALEVLQGKIKPDWIIAEISSYQIESSPEIAPTIGIWTTLTPDHLKRHYTLENYGAIKAHLLNQSQTQILNGDDPGLRQMEQQWPQAIWTSIQGPLGLPPSGGLYLHNNWVMDGGQPIVEATGLKMAGNHNQQNLLLAIAAARKANITSKAVFAQAIATFPGVPHRLEQVGIWQGIQFINDSKATNYDAAEVGLTAVDGSVVLIAGGQAKTGADEAWLAQIQAKATAVILIGSAASAFAQRLAMVHYTAVEVVAGLAEAVPLSLTLAQKYEAQVVLLSPACASFDQYANFEQRGDHFRRLCQELVNSPPA